MGARFEAEDDRRLQLIEATVDTLDAVGFAAASLVQIAGRAGVAPSLVSHYFGDKDGLLEATLRHLARRITSDTASRLRQANGPRERVLAVIDANLAPTEFDPRSGNVWLAFWAQVPHSNRLNRVQRAYQQRLLSNLRHDLRKMVDDRNASRIALAVAALIDGLWLRSTLSGRGELDGDTARAIARSFLASRIATARERPTAVMDATPVSNVAGRSLGAGIPDLDTMQGVQSAWNTLSWDQRGRALLHAVPVFRERSAELAALWCRRTGRPIRATMREAASLVCMMETIAAHAIVGSTERRVHDGRRTMSRRSEPLGIVAVPSDSRQSLSIVFNDVVTAVCAGNAVVCPGDAPEGIVELLAEILVEGGLPAGLIAASTLEATTADLPRNDIRLSWPLGYGEASSEPSVLPRILVFDDADIGTCVDTVIRLAFQDGPTGRRGVVAYVEAIAMETFRARLKDRIALLAIGDPMDMRTDVGPLRPSEDRAALAAYAATIRDGGAECIGVGQMAGDHEAGTRLTVLEWPDGLRFQEPPEGPVLVIRAIMDDEAPPHPAEQTQDLFICTSDHARAMRLADHIRADRIHLEQDNDFVSTSIGPEDRSFFDRFVRYRRIIHRS